MDTRGVLSDRIRAAFEGCYEAQRAAALSGVPESTVYHWARSGLIKPSVSPTRIMLWSYADLMALRVVYWLRHPKQGRNREIAASPMSQVRMALDELARRELDIWDDSMDGLGSPLRVDQSGKIWVQANGIVETGGQQALPGALDLLGPFDLGRQRGPDLLRPRPHLRIIPGKVSGDPTWRVLALPPKSPQPSSRQIPDVGRIATLYVTSTPACSKRPSTSSTRSQRDAAAARSELPTVDPRRAHTVDGRHRLWRRAQARSPLSDPR